jgi:hypothetical protein
MLDVCSSWCGALLAAPDLPPPTAVLLGTQAHPSTCKWCLGTRKIWAGGPPSDAGTPDWKRDGAECPGHNPLLEAAASLPAYLPAVLLQGFDEQVGGRCTALAHSSLLYSWWLQMHLRYCAPGLVAGS